MTSFPLFGKDCPANLHSALKYRSIARTLVLGLWSQGAGLGRSFIDVLAMSMRSCADFRLLCFVLPCLPRGVDGELDGDGLDGDLRRRCLRVSVSSLRSDESESDGGVDGDERFERVLCVRRRPLDVLLCVSELRPLESSLGGSWLSVRLDPLEDVRRSLRVRALCDAVGMYCVLPSLVCTTDARLVTVRCSVLSCFVRSSMSSRYLDVCSELVALCADSRMIVGFGVVCFENSV